MKDKYKQLGFNHPKFLENPYGIRIYIGTDGEDDWCVEIPKRLCKKFCGKFNCDNGFTFYFVTEKLALEIAEKYTKLAKRCIAAKKNSIA